MKKILALLMIALLLGACASQEAFRQARVEVEAGNEEAGLAQLEEQIKANPNDVELRNYYLGHKRAALRPGERARQGRHRAPEERSRAAPGAG